MAMSEQEKAVQNVKDPAARKQAYYKLQREHAEETGDTGTVNRISSKGYKAKTGGDPEQVNHRILGAVGDVVGAGEGALLAGGARMAARAAAKKGAADLIPRASEALGSAGRAIGSRIRSAIGNKGQKALGKTTGRLASKGTAKALTGEASPMRNVTPAKPKPKAQFESSGARKGTKLSKEDQRRSLQTQPHQERRALPPASSRTSGISQADARQMRKVERDSGAPQPTPKNKGKAKAEPKSKIKNPTLRNAIEHRGGDTDFHTPRRRAERAAGTIGKGLKKLGKKLTTNVGSEDFRKA
jgi:hypothetical protein